ncbi:MAG: zinc ribbon domain-containing protein [Anaerolineae bacterium]|nr:zinc ribbon domain-containing protein [Anaerolineae bacterium]MBN8618390.1 zinc ribbon domain-containing protein [Anaerolineae bacterium]
MPIYDYHCSHCNTTFPVRKSMSEINDPSACPECESLDTQRLISVVAIFSRSSAGERRNLASASACGGCSAAGSGCASCRPR